MVTLIHSWASRILYFALRRSKKLVTSMSFKPEPAIQPCYTGQQIHCFESCQLTWIQIVYLGLQVSKCDISHPLTWRADVRTYVWVDERTDELFCQNQNFLDAWITKFHYPWCSAARVSKTLIRPSSFIVNTAFLVLALLKYYYSKQIESTISVLSERGFIVRRRNYNHCSNRWQVFALMG